MNYNQGMMMPGTLEGKVVIVTGGGTGLGKSMTQYFLTLGAKVVIVSRNSDKLNETAQQLRTECEQGEILTYALDVREYEAVETMVDFVIDHLGKIDILVNNAAGNFISPTERLSSRAFDIIIDIVLKGSKNCTLAIGKYWIKNNLPGTVLSIVTTYSWTGSGYVVPSAMAKAGVLAMTRSLAVEWGKYKIRFNAIAPGPFPTKGAWERLLPGHLKEKFDLTSKNPLKRVGEHQELSNLAAFLISDYSSFINGEVVTIDGGEWLQGAGEFNIFDQITPEEWEYINQNIKKINK
ncbi:SDR family oxidoreductase [Apibacter raozihei]|uniref:SDR family oxidoreductase n=1 Tax=Apibacter raozihei TaxID=2500547 RepID=UPI000FE3199F|nr:SDR family oxidoreductase [Apibacter raozihei]